MSEFEDVHFSTSEEIRLSRELACVIAREIESLPQSVLDAYSKLKKHYYWQIENGMQ